jgi:hypothetical protein
VLASLTAANDRGTLHVAEHLCAWGCHGEPRPRGAAATGHATAALRNGSDGKLRGAVGFLPALTPDSSLDVARFWFRRYLEQSGHPPNTVKSYSYDLAVFESLVGPKPIREIDERDVATFLNESRGRSTRKRD